MLYEVITNQVNGTYSEISIDNLALKNISEGGGSGSGETLEYWLEDTETAWVLCNVTDGMEIYAESTEGYSPNGSAVFIYFDDFSTEPTTGTISVGTSKYHAYIDFGELITLADRIAEYDISCTARIYDNYGPSNLIMLEATPIWEQKPSMTFQVDTDAIEGYINIYITSVITSYSIHYTKLYDGRI